MKKLLAIVLCAVLVGAGFFGITRAHADNDLVETTVSIENEKAVVEVKAKAAFLLQGIQVIPTFDNEAFSLDTKGECILGSPTIGQRISADTLPEIEVEEGKTVLKLFFSKTEAFDATKDYTFSLEFVEAYSDADSLSFEGETFTVTLEGEEPDTEPPTETEPQSPQPDPEKVYTPDELIELMAGYADNEVSAVKATVKGVATKSTFNSRYTSYNVWLQTEGEAAFEIYSGVLVDTITEDYTAADAMKDCTVTAVGYLKKYVKNGAVTYEVSYLNATESPTGAADSPSIIEVIAPEPDVEYTFEGEEAVTVANDTTEDLLFVIHRSVDDENALNYFDHAEIDGEALPDGSYEAVSGSVKLSLKSSLINELDPGAHTLKAVFTDGSAEIRFTVEEAEEPSGTDPANDDTDPVNDDTDPVNDDTDPVNDDTDPVNDDTDPVNDDTDPVNNDTTEDPNGGSQAGNPGANTGETSPMLWIGLVAICGLAGAVLFVTKRKAED